MKEILCLNKSITKIKDVLIKKKLKTEGKDDNYSLISVSLSKFLCILFQLYGINKNPHSHRHTSGK